MDDISSRFTSKSISMMSAPTITPPFTRQGSPLPMRTMKYHAEATLKSWETLTELHQGSTVMFDGDNLDIASLVAVAKYNSKAELVRSENVISRISESVAMLQRHLNREKLVYGVNTGFGGSADVRTTNLQALQRGLVQHQNSGILTYQDTMVDNRSHPSPESHSASMPTAWTRGMMLARLNSIVRGHSAVTLNVIETIISFLRNDLTPVIPVRGSVSASGDLIPLSYLAAALQGNPNIFMRVGKPGENYRVVPASEALKSKETKPIVLAAKEGLGLLNGTAASVSVASLAIYECNHLAVLSQILTAMGCEALKGNADSFHPFVADVRPHKGQGEAAASILGFLSGTRLAQGLKGGENHDDGGLAQDRYALRTASQWIGPQLEDLLLATEQITVELNSTTDNPLMNTARDTIHHGGNFQAASITSAMEKTRLAMQMLGKMLFAQATEIINPAYSRGLPPNLCADDPSVSFTCKGIDIAMAGYYSELAFLSNPVSTHVQSAEMHNQAINSLALISARYTLQAVEIISMMCASYLVMVCQALDLRVLQIHFFGLCRPKFAEITGPVVHQFLVAEPEFAEKAVQGLWTGLQKAWDDNISLDLLDRSVKTAEVMTASLLREIAKADEPKCSVSELFAATNAWKRDLELLMKDNYETARHELFENHLEITPKYLGQASSKVYVFIRDVLKVPFHRGLVDCPLEENEHASFPLGQGKSIGSLISIVYEALRDGQLHEPVMAAVKQDLP